MACGANICFCTGACRLRPEELQGPPNNYRKWRDLLEEYRERKRVIDELARLSQEMGLYEPIPTEDEG